MNEGNAWDDWVWSTLGVARGADALTVRRAYARVLKGIDQRADAAGFQRLRQAYEMAQRLVERSAPVADAMTEKDRLVSVDLPADTSESAEIAVVSPVQAEPADSAPDYFQQAVAIYQVFARETVAATATQMKRELRALLASEPLQALAVREAMEWIVLQDLFTERANRVPLIAAAVEVFGWEADINQLNRFRHPVAGRAARWIDDRNVVRAMPANSQNQIKSALNIVKAHAGSVSPQPKLREIAAVRDVFRLAQRGFPTWFACQFTREQFEWWCKSIESLPEHVKPSRLLTSRQDLFVVGMGGYKIWLWILAILFIITVFMPHTPMPSGPVPQIPPQFQPMSQFKVTTPPGAVESRFSIMQGSMCTNVKPEVVMADPKMLKDCVAYWRSLRSSSGR